MFVTAISSKTIGNIAENLARNYLLAQGLKFIEANYQCKCGEIDLIMQDGDTIVFIEVRHRAAHDYGDGIATVTRTKQHKLIKTAMHYLQKNNLLDILSCRFDVIATAGDDCASIKWVQDAFWEKW